MVYFVNFGSLLFHFASIRLTAGLWAELFNKFGELFHNFGELFNTIGELFTLLGNFLTTLRNFLTTLGNFLTTLRNFSTILGNLFTTLGNSLMTLGNFFTTLGNFWLTRFSLFWRIRLTLDLTDISYLVYKTLVWFRIIQLGENFPSNPKQVLSKIHMHLV